MDTGMPLEAIGWCLISGFGNVNDNWRVVRNMECWNSMIHVPELLSYPQKDPESTQGVLSPLMFMRLRYSLPNVPTGIY